MAAVGGVVPGRRLEPAACCSFQPACRRGPAADQPALDRQHLEVQPVSPALLRADDHHTGAFTRYHMK